MAAKKASRKAAKKGANESTPHPSRMGAPKPKDVDAYLARLDPAQRKALQVVRKRIHAAQPGLVEAISYGIPFFKLRCFLGMMSRASPCASPRTGPCRPRSCR